MATSVNALHAQLKARRKLLEETTRLNNEAGTMLARPAIICRTSTIISSAFSYLYGASYSMFRRKLQLVLIVQLCIAIQIVGVWAHRLVSTRHALEALEEDERVVTKATESKLAFLEGRRRGDGAAPAAGAAAAGGGGGGGGGRNQRPVPRPRTELQWLDSVDDKVAAVAALRETCGSVAAQVERWEISLSASSSSPSSSSAAPGARTTTTTTTTTRTTRDVLSLQLRKLSTGLGSLKATVQACASLPLSQCNRAGICLFSSPASPRYPSHFSPPPLTHLPVSLMHRTGGGGGLL